MIKLLAEVEAEGGTDVEEDTERLEVEDACEANKYVEDTCEGEAFRLD